MPVYAAAGMLEAVWIEKARRELGYEPRVSLSEMIREYAEDYRG